MRAFLTWGACAALLAGMATMASAPAEARGLKFSTGAKVVGSGARAYDRSQRNKEREDEAERGSEPGAEQGTLMGTRSAPSGEGASNGDAPANGQETPATDTAAKAAAAVVAAAPTPPIDPDAPIVCVAGCGGLPKSYPSGAKGVR